MCASSNTISIWCTDFNTEYEWILTALPNKILICLTILLSSIDNQVLICLHPFNKIFKKNKVWPQSWWLSALGPASAVTWILNDSSYLVRMVLKTNTFHVHVCTSAQSPHEACSISFQKAVSPISYKVGKVCRQYQEKVYKQGMRYRLPREKER